MELTEKRCIPCRGGIPPLKGAELQKLKAKVLTWSVIEEHHLEKEFKFPDFKKALEFVNKVGALAEQEQHHPNIEFTWGKAKITIYTHKINGLHENDFILAAKIDKL
ncbi:MAG TPA: 4a-hydroxytetrahydrobiopterin dehydratase [Candidatus Nanoarchaeia archaeon]|nr:4a-hydroxytetrahydrobiopterin dehydratase [Candidatus Nanoarchaeia archaeon]